MVIDGHSTVYRAYYALAPNLPLTLRSTGEPVGAVFGFANMFLRAWADLKPTYWAVTFDKAGPTFRDELYKDYKAGRAETPDELTAQFGRIHEMLDALGLPTLEIDGYEADDLIGTLSRRAEEQGIDTIVLTGDTDMLQLVDPHIQIRLTTGKAETRIYDIDGVRERYGIGPEQMVDFKSLKGDTSDNIIGVPGIGDKTAAKLLQQFDTVEGVYEHIGEVEPPRIRGLLEEHEERVKLNQTLVRIVTDVPIEFDFELARTDRFERQRAVEFFQDMEFHTFTERLPVSGDVSEPAQSVSTETIEKEYEAVETEGALQTLVERLASAGQFSLSAVTTNTLSMSGDLVGLAFSTRPGEGAYVPFGHTLGTQVEAAKVLAALKPVLEDPQVAKIAHNGKFDTTVLANQGIHLQGLVADVTIAAYILGARGLDLRKQAFERLREELPEPKEILGSGAKRITMAQALVEQVVPYACAQADCTGRLWTLLETDLRAQGLDGLFNDVEMTLLPVLERMERYGVAINVELLRQMAREMVDDLHRIEAEAYDSVAHEFKINSPQQLGSLLFEELQLHKLAGFERPKRTKTGYSTDAQVLEGLRDVHPVVGHVLEFRQISKIKSTYVDSLPELVNPRTGRVHTTLSQTVAATGRLSSSDPNLQNIPVRTELGKRVRNAFIAQGDWLLLSADYSQIELRILAHITQDPGLLGAFHRDEDIHASTAATVFSVPLEEVTEDQRRFAKVVNFGLLYGMSEFGLATRSDRTREEAAPIIKEYFESYPGIQQYLDDTKRTVREKGYVETLLGRRRYVPEVHAANFQVRAAGERMAINAPIQGAAADVIKLGMIQLQDRMDAMALQSRMILQVHDELIFETPEDEIEPLKELVLEIMPHAMELSVPLKVDLKQGLTWGEME
jgi:DNA polymerase-1